MRKTQKKTGVSRTRKIRVWPSHLIVSMLVIASSFFVLAPTRPVLAEVFSCPPGDVSCLIDAINMANATDEGDRIILSAGTYSLTEADNYSDSTIGNGLPSIMSKITIEGAGADNTIIDGNRLLRIFHVADTGTLVIDGLTVHDGSVFWHPQSDNGGCVFNRGTLKVKNSTISRGFAAGHGGCIYNYGGTLIIRESTFFRCEAEDGSGGAIWNEGGTLLVKDSTFTQNRNNFGVGGGGIGNSCGTAIIRSSTFSDCGGDTQGGAVYNDNCGEMIITNSDISGSFTVDQGGGIFNEGNLIIKHSTVSDNEAEDDQGGGIYNSGRLVIEKSSISNNDCAGRGGGGIYNTNSLTVKNSLISGNRSLSRGGGINNDGGTVTLKNTTVAGNTAWWEGGGGIYNTNILTIQKGIISGNTANDGGGIYNDGGTVTLKNTTVADNDPNDCVGCP